MPYPHPTSGKWLQRKTRSPLFQRERIWSEKHGAAAVLWNEGKLWCGMPPKFLRTQRKYFYPNRKKDIHNNNSGIFKIFEFITVVFGWRPFVGLGTQPMWELRLIVWFYTHYLLPSILQLLRSTNCEFKRTITIISHPYVHVSRPTIWATLN